MSEIYGGHFNSTHFFKICEEEWINRRVIKNNSLSFSFEITSDIFF